MLTSQKMIECDVEKHATLIGFLSIQKRSFIRALRLKFYTVIHCMRTIS